MTTPIKQVVSPVLVNGGYIDHPYWNSYKNYQTPYSYWNSISEKSMLNNTTSYKTYIGQDNINKDIRYALYTPRENYNTLFSKDSLELMQIAIRNSLEGIHPQGKHIIVPLETIRSIADSIYENSRREVHVMQAMIINYIVNNIKTEYDTIQKNNNMSIWNTKYTEETGMKSFDGIKLNNRGARAEMQFRY